MNSLINLLGMAFVGLFATLANGQTDQDDAARELETLKRDVQQLKQEKSKPAKIIYAPEKFPEQALRNRNVIMYIGGVPVITSPYLGRRSAFDGSDLVVNISSVNQDLRLLEQRQALENMLVKQGIPLPKRPTLELSGDVIGRFQYEDPYVGDGTADVDLIDLKLIAVASINPSLTAYASIAYDNGAPSGGGQRLANSRVFLDKGFLTLGRLNQLPYYATFGQLQVPFGRYNSNLMSVTLPFALAKTKARPLVFGFKETDKERFFGAVYGFKGDSGLGHKAVLGANLGYRFAKNKINGELGAGYINNIADSDGLQSTGGTGFTGFGANDNTELLVHRVPALNVNANVNFAHCGLLDNCGLIGELIMATQSFNSNDLRFNGDGANLRAWHLEGVTRFDVLKRSASFAIGYGGTNEALALNLPKRRISGTLNIGIWRNTITSFEIRHDTNYGSGDSAGGRGGASGIFTAYNAGDTLGKGATTFSAQLAAFF